MTTERPENPRVRGEFDRAARKLAGLARRGAPPLLLSRMVCSLLAQALCLWPQRTGEALGDVLSGKVRRGCGLCSLCGADAAERGLCRECHEEMIKDEPAG